MRNNLIVIVLLAALLWLLWDKLAGWLQKASGAVGLPDWLPRPGANEAPGGGDAAPAPDPACAGRVGVFFDGATWRDCGGVGMSHPSESIRWDGPVLAYTGPSNIHWRPAAGVYL